MQMDDRILVDLLIERRYITSELLESSLRDMTAQGKQDAGLAVYLLTNGLLSEANLFELAQLYRAKKMDPSDAQADTPRVAPSPLRTDIPTVEEVPVVAPAARPTVKPITAQEIPAASPQPKPAAAPPARDPRRATGHDARIPASADARKGSTHGEVRAVKSTGHEMKAVDARIRSTGHELKAVDARVRSTGHEMKAVKSAGPALKPAQRKLPSAATAPGSGVINKPKFSAEDIENATAQTLVENRKPKQFKEGELPAEAAEAAKFPDYCFKNFILTQELGRGGMGVVWKAWQKGLNRWVAIKFLEGESKPELERFLREAQSVSMLSHPNITALYELGEFEGNYYIVMEYVDGQQIQEFLGKLQIDTCVKVFHVCANALEHAHKNNIIHRDIKPQNIMLTRQGKPYLMDFGLAKRRDAESSATMAGMILGTPAFMSPEQAEGKWAKVDKRSDVYSLAATMYATLAGRPPFEGRAVMDTLYKVVNNEPTPLRARNPQIPEPVAAIVHKAMSKTAIERYISMRDFAADLQRYLHREPVLAMNPAPGRRAPGTASGAAVATGTSKLPFIIAGAVTAIALIISLILLLRKGDTEKTRDTDASGPTDPSAADMKALLERAQKDYAAAREMLKLPGARWTALLERAQKALASAEEAARKAPTSTEAALLTGRIHALMEKTAAADAALGRAGEGGATRLELGLLHFDGDESKSLFHFRKCADLSKNDHEVRFARACVAWLEGRARDAIEGASSLLKIEARPEYYWLRARAHDRAQDTAAALADYQEAMRLEPNRRPFVLGTAEMLRRLNRAAQAEVVLQQYTSFRAEDDLALMCLARVKAAQNDASAPELANRAVALNAERLEHYRERAAVLFAFKRVREAEADATRYLEKHPDDAQTLAIRGLCRHEAGNYAGAESDLKTAVRDPAENPAAYSALADIADRDSRKEDVLKACDGLMTCKTATGTQLFETGRLYDKYKRLKDSIRALDRAWDLDPKNQDIALQRLLSCITGEEWEKAEASARRYAELTGSESGLHINLGTILLKRKKFDDAIKEFTRGLEIDARSYVGYMNRGHCYFDMGRWKEAVADYRKAIEIRPEVEPRLRDDLREAEKLANP